MAKQVFFSFHYQRDHWRVQQVIQMGALEGQPILSPQKWEEVRRQGDAAVEKWIADQMRYKSAVVVLVGHETSTRPWVRREIAYAWNNRKPMVGVMINGLADSLGHTDRPGSDPFKMVQLDNGGTVADYVRLHTPLGVTSTQVYANIKQNLSSWVDGAYARP